MPCEYRQAQRVLGLAAGRRSERPTPVRVGKGLPQGASQRPDAVRRHEDGLAVANEELGYAGDIGAHDGFAACHGGDDRQRTGVLFDRGMGKDVERRENLR